MDDNEKKSKKMIIIIIIASILIIMLIFFLLFFYKKTDNVNSNENTAETGELLGIAGIYNDTKKGSKIEVKESKDNIQVFENNNLLFENNKYDGYDKQFREIDTLDDFFVLSGEFGQTYGKAIILNSKTKEVVKNLTEINNKGVYEIKKVNDGYFFLFTGILDVESPYLFEAFSDKTNIINLEINDNDNHYDYYKPYFYQIIDNYLFYASEYQKNVKIEKVDVFGNVNNSLEYDSVMCIENDYAVAYKDEALYLIDLKDNFKEYKIIDYSNDFGDFWHIEKSDSSLIVIKKGISVTDGYVDETYKFDLNTKKIVID